MLRFQSALCSGLAALLVVPVFVGQGDVASLADALSGTRRALEVLHGLEKRVSEDPAAALGLVLSATEAPRGDDAERERALEHLRNEVGLLQMELDALQSPMLASDGSVQGALGTRVPLSSMAALDSQRAAAEPGITTGLDDDLRALLGGASATRTTARTAARPATRGPQATSTGANGDEAGDAGAYSADPLRHGVACYRAGRYAEAHELLAPLSGASALYWQARTLERLERLDEAVERMERALPLARAGDGAGAGEGDIDAHRIEADLEFLRWKRDFVKNLPARRAARAGEPR